MLTSTVTMKLLQKSLQILSMRRRHFQQLVYSVYGNPIDVLRINEGHVTNLEKNSSHVGILMAPVNPADINTIQGTYPIKPPMPAVPGGECVAKVVKSDLFNTGDRVVITKLGWGTWKEAGVIENKFLYKIPLDMPDELACQLSVNPCTAYRMLKDFVKLTKEDVVIQNGANSAVGQYVIQLCKAWGITTINVIRKRKDFDDLANTLKSLGADFVISDDDLSKGLNCVGGRNATDVARSLSKGGYLVTYGGMSKQPVILPTATYIFSDIRAVGFWMSRWKEQNHGKNCAKEMLDDLCHLFSCGMIRTPVIKAFPLSRWKEALENSMKGFSNAKIVFKMV